MIDKSNWLRVKFGDVVKEIKNDVNRNNNAFQNYVAGEHMKSEDLHITEYGTFGIDYVGPAFKRIFKKGNILYGSRRTYLKKVALAEFDGITSNTTLVLETKSEKILSQKLLPFIMLSYKFTEHSIQESRGSVNPYIVFSDIAKFEFLLPPIDEQQHIAELLWAADEVVQKYKMIYKTIDKYILPELINNNIACEDSTEAVSIVSLPDVTFFQEGPGILAKDFKKNGVPLIRLSGIGSATVTLDGCNYLDEEMVRKKWNHFRLDKGDIVISSSASIGKTAIVDDDAVGSILYTGLIRFKTSEKILREYLFLLFSSRCFLEQISKRQTRPHIKAGGRL